MTNEKEINKDNKEINKDNKEIDKDNKEILDFLKDVPQKIQVELARKEISLQKIIKWKKGEIINFDKIAGDKFDVIIGETLIARGEIVIINDKFGLKINEITRPGEIPGG